MFRSEVICPRGCGAMLAGEVLWVCGWCGASVPRGQPASFPPPEMVEIPDGEFRLGSPTADPDASDDERPSRIVHLSVYRISLHPVTNGQYLEFVRAKDSPQPPHWQARPPIGANASHPVCFVSWFEARAYCEWLSDHVGQPYGLPTEAQWEKAARGGFWLDGDRRATAFNQEPDRRFPSGGLRLSPAEANFGGLHGGTTPVGSFPQGASPYGCLDLAGNVSEWCLDSYDPGFYRRAADHDPASRRGERRTLRGGSWRSESAHVRCSNRYPYSPGRRSYGVGFRVAQTLERS